jgi:hypothetical protein
MGGGLPFFERENPIDPASLARLPLLFVHGDRDDIIPVSASERTVKALRKSRAAAPVDLRILPGRPHDVVFGRDEGLTFPFLEGRVRDPFPREVSLRARSLAHARAYWVEVLEKGGGTAEVDASVEGGAITLRTKSVRKLRLLLRPDLVPFDAPLRVTLDGREAFSGALSEDAALLLRTWRATGDPQLAHSAEILLDVR